MGTEIVAAATAVKDGWGLAALALIGIFAVIWKHARAFLQTFFSKSKDNNPHAERRRANDILIQQMMSRIESLEKGDHEKSEMISKMGEEMQEAKLHFARCDTELRIMRNENKILQQRISAFERTIQRSAGFGVLDSLPAGED